MYLKKSKMWALACVAAAVMGASSASAKVISFAGGQTGAAEGVSTSCQVFGILNSSCSVTYNAAGLGVKGNPDLQPGQIDGSPVKSGESLTLSFGHDVAWNNVMFGKWDNDDDATISADGGLSFYYSNNSSMVDLGGYVSSQLTVTAYGKKPGDCAFFCVFGNDSFTVKSIDVQSVPVPAAGFLLLAGLGGLAALRRKQK